MKTAAKTPKVKDSYLELVKRFPLVPIKTESQYDAAIAFLKKLAIRDESSLDVGEAAYLDALTLFVEDFQNTHHLAGMGGMSAVEAVKYLMNEHAMTPADLGRVLGNRSLATQVLHGGRQLSKSNIIALARHFGVSTALFLPVSG